MSSPASSAQSEKPTRSVNTIASRSSPGLLVGPVGDGLPYLKRREARLLEDPGALRAASPSRRATTARASEPVVESGSPYLLSPGSSSRAICIALISRGAITARSGVLSESPLSGIRSGAITPPTPQPLHHSM